MPFYGRYINNVILTTGGGLLTGSINDASTELQIPSYIAPFLTGMPPSDRDTVIFNDTLDKGGEFVLQWDKHHGPDDKNLRLQVQLRILLDGTLSFLYKNFHQAILDVIDDKGYPLAIGLKDGFAVINANATKGTIFAKNMIAFFYYIYSRCIYRAQGLHVPRLHDQPGSSRQSSPGSGDLGTRRRPL